MTVPFDRAREDDRRLMARFLWMAQVSQKWAVNRRVQNVHASHELGLFHHHQPGPFAWRIQ
jgi:hypothetical protein